MHAGHYDNYFYLFASVYFLTTHCEKKTAMDDPQVETIDGEIYEPLEAQKISRRSE